MARRARERIDHLLGEARAAAKAGDDERSRRYIRRARRIGERHREPVGRRFKRVTCAACDRYLLPGRTARVRLQPGRVVITCDCGERARIPTARRGEK